MTKTEVRALQERMNRFTSKYVPHLARLRVDGVMGALTRGRIRTCKYYLGYRRPLNAGVTHEFNTRLNHPRSMRYPGRMKILSSPRRLARAFARRRKARREHEREKRPRSGVSMFDGRPVAAWMKPHLEWARDHGWDGTLVSGYRTPEYSESLCRRMCGRPSCPGRCAGRASNHSGKDKPRGAVDVSYYWEFAQIIRNCPHSPRIFNALGARDPVHFSASGN